MPTHTHTHTHTHLHLVAHRVKQVLFFFQTRADRGNRISKVKNRRKTHLNTDNTRENVDKEHFVVNFERHNDNDEDKNADSSNDSPTR